METQERNNKKAKGVSAESGVEGMIPSSARHQFTSVLKAEQLADIPSSFRDPAFFDEVPLYSRYEQVDFLRQYGEADRLLLELSLEYLQRVKSEWAANNLERFIAVTIVRDEANEYIVPYIFICNSDARRRLKNLHLTPPSKGLGKHIQSLMQKTDYPQDYLVLEDRSAVSDDVKVFISYKSPPQGLISLDAFRQGPEHPMTEREWSERIWPTLVDWARKRGTVSYASLKEAVGFRGWQKTFSQCLGRIANYCHLKRWPILTVVVVNKRTGKPGGGIPFVEDFDAELKRVHAFPWQKHPTPVSEEFPESACLSRGRGENHD